MNGLDNREKPLNYVQSALPNKRHDEMSKKIVFWKNTLQHNLQRLVGIGTLFNVVFITSLVTWHGHLRLCWTFVAGFLS